MKYVQLAQFCHKKRNLLDSGVDISKAVQMLADEESGVLKDKLNKAAASVRGGNSLSDAFRQQNLPAEIINRTATVERDGNEV